MYQDCYTGGWWSNRLEGDVKLPVSDKVSLEPIIVRVALSGLSFDWEKRRGYST